VGGFAASDWLYQSLKIAFTSEGLNVSRPDGHLCVSLLLKVPWSGTNLLISNKAVADGGVSFYIDHFVTARFSKFAYGIKIHKEYDASNTEHRRRKNSTFMTSAGYLGIRGIFSVILPQVRDAQR
jgi:hypothetical protein